MSKILICEAELPDDYRPADFLSFHQRDPSMLAEQVEGNCLRKGLAWRGKAACLSIRFEHRQARAELTCDGPLPACDDAAIGAMVRRMLGLTQQIEAFEAAYHDHAQVGRLIAKNPGLRLPVSATPFEALTWAITGQQISVNAALSLRRGLIKGAGIKHSSGLYCYPDATAIVAMTDASLRQAGFSHAKAATLFNVSQLIVANRLSFDTWRDGDTTDALTEQLLRIRGIGPWTVNYALLRGFGWLDGWIASWGRRRAPRFASLARPL